MVRGHIIVPQNFLQTETRNGYTIPLDMKLVWEKQLEILNEIDRICSIHGITYYAIGGTLLGAIRHKGYIPWDDDIDIAMLREDYDRFCCIAVENLKSPFFLQTEKTDPGYLIRHAKVRNSDTTGILKSQSDNNYSFNQGIFVDLFPLDRIPDDKIEEFHFFADLYELWGTVHRLSSAANRENMTFLKDSEKELSREQLRVAAYRSNVSYEECSSKYKDCQTKRVAILPLTILPDTISTRWIFDSCLFSSTEMSPFEFMSIPVPKSYKEILNNTYGEWTVLKQADSLHGEVFFDVNKSYKAYIK